MKITKVINNNTVATYIDEKREVILTGLGIGYNKRVGDKVEIEKIDKVYQMKDQLFAKYEQIFKNTPAEYFKIAEKIRQKAEKEFSIQLSSQLVFALTDHITFAVERQQKAEAMPNLMLQEVRMLYNEEYQIGEYGRKLMERVTGIPIPIDEAGYIALHIVNARINDYSIDVNNVVLLVEGIFKIIRREIGDCFEENSFEGIRFSTHLKFLAQRIFKNEQIKLSVVESMFPTLLKRDARLEGVIEKIRVFIYETFDYSISNEEATYLAVYIIRIIES